MNNYSSILPLVIRSLQGELDDAQQLELDAWLTAHPKAKNWYDSLDETAAADLAARGPAMLRELEADIFHQIQAATGIGALPGVVPATVYAPRAHRVHFLKTAWFRYAAAIVLLIGVGTAGYWLLTDRASNDTVQQSTATTDPGTGIVPGSNKAILTLSDGRRVELDSATSGTITDQHLSIENNNGQLRYGTSELVAYNTMTTPKGGQYQVILPDGTKVWLNAASRITYPTAFTGSNRTVNIEGEAYFEVTKDARKPFIVKTYQDEITVLGTAFNINAYKDEQMIKTSLVEGSVRINEKILEPGQAYVNGKISTTNIQQDIAWKNGLFDFTNMMMSDAMQQLARWYDIEVELAGDFADIRFMGKIDRFLSLQDVLNGLERPDMHFTLSGKTLRVHR